MPVSFAVVLALFMRRKRGQTRLQQIRERLKGDPITKRSLRQWPLQNMLTACFLFGVVMMVGWIGEELPRDVLEREVSPQLAVW